MKKAGTVHGLERLKMNASNTIRQPIVWNSSAATDVGVVRKINEDSVLNCTKSGLWAVADGMGGYEAGDVASNMIVKSLSELKPISDLCDFVNLVEDTITDSNFRILEYADIMLDGRTLGSTIISLIIRDMIGVCFWAGDSRLYRYRNGNIEQLTRDHSHVEELIDRGIISREEADNHPESNVITRAVGAQMDLILDFATFDVAIGDVYTLCSDGLYNSIDLYNLDKMIYDKSPDEITSNFIKMALYNGASDNVSVVVVKGELSSSRSLNKSML